MPPKYVRAMTASLCPAQLDLDDYRGRAFGELVHLRKSTNVAGFAMRLSHTKVVKFHGLLVIMMMLLLNRGWTHPAIVLAI